MGHRDMLEQYSAYPRRKDIDAPDLHRTVDTPGQIDLQRRMLPQPILEADP